MNFRLMLIAAGALAAVLLSIPAWADALLRPTAVVTGDDIRLGDLFDGVGDKADAVVARSPEPGRRAIVDADWLHHVATLNGIDWQSDDPFLELVIERPGITIDRDRIAQEVTAALAKQGAPAGTDVEIANRDLRLIIPTDAPATLAVRDLVYDPGTQRFSAVVEAPADAKNPERLSIAGRVYELTDVPVLAHPMARGEVITARDLTFARLRKDTLRRDAIVDVDQIIGMTPRNNLRTGQLVAVSDLQRPVAVARGALVTMVLEEGTMRLTVQGRANEPGSVGDVIRVTNTRSNLIVPARVEGPNLVTVGVGATPTPSGVAMAN